MIYSIHESDGQDVTMLTETAYALTSGGVNQGKDIQLF